MIGQQVGAREQVLARSNANLQVERAVGAEQPGGGDRPLGGHGDLGEQLVHQPLLVVTQRLALGAAVEAADVERVGHGFSGQR